jgi:hypothetical protein
VGGRVDVVVVDDVVVVRIATITVGPSASAAPSDAHTEKEMAPSTTPATRTVRNLADLLKILEG